MISLLPPEKKQAITYARRNNALIRWIGVIWISLVGVVAIVLFGLIYMNQAIKANNQQIAGAQTQLKVQKFDDTQREIQDISSSLKLVVQVLGKEVLFSKLLQQIGSAMPPNTVLTNLSINTLQGGLDLQAGATDYQAATQVQVNLRDPNNKIFSNADIINIQCNSGASGSDTTTAVDTTARSKYPCTVTIRAQFSKDNPFLFIQKGAKP